MKIVCTHPGRFGDLVWSLPTARLLSERSSLGIEFATSEKYGDQSLMDVLAAQPYISSAHSVEGWIVEESAPISPRTPPYSWHDTYVYHLGYKGWPVEPLPFWAARSAGLELPPEALDRPWISLGEVRRDPKLVVVGFTEEWIELKMGILLSVAERLGLYHFKVLIPTWKTRHEEWSRTIQATSNVCLAPCNWEGATRWMQEAACYFGCLSALWVLANATGTKAVVMEPNKDRWHPSFWVERERNRMVRGMDGNPTHDARHCLDTLKEILG